jgi:small subunit ribosomal protein S14
MARLAMIIKFKKTPKFKVRKHNRCEICGRPRGFMRKFKMCRICFRNFANNGLIVGVSKSSW